MADKPCIFCGGACGRVCRGLGFKKSQAKEPEASGHNRLEAPKGTSHRGSSRLSAGRTAQDAAPSSDGGRVAIQELVSQRGNVPDNKQALTRNRGTSNSASKRPKSSEVGKPAPRMSTPSAVRGETIGAKAMPSPETSGASDSHPKRGPGRPKIEGPRPWQVEGISRSTWNRRRKAEQT